MQALPKQCEPAARTGSLQREKRLPGTRMSLSQTTIRRPGLLGLGLSQALHLRCLRFSRGKCLPSCPAPLQTLCHLAKAASSADAVALLDCIRFQLMTAHELAAAALYLQHNSKWVDKRLSTVLAWRLLNARTAADLRAWPAPAGIPGERSSTTGGSGVAAAAAATAAARFQGLGLHGDGGSGRGGGDNSEEHPRLMRQRCLVWGLSMAALSAWDGATM